MDTVLGDQLRNGQLTTDRLQRDLGLELGRIPLPLPPVIGSSSRKGEPSLAPCPRIRDHFSGTRPPCAANWRRSASPASTRSSAPGAPVGDGRIPRPGPTVVHGHSHDQRNGHRRRHPRAAARIVSHDRVSAACTVRANGAVTAVAAKPVRTARRPVRSCVSTWAALPLIVSGLRC
jgi:hypothetical protein